MWLLLGAAANPPHLPMASTHMRNQLLEMHGWQVVSIPFNRWNRLSSLQEKQASHCVPACTLISCVRIPLPLAEPAAVLRCCRTT